MRTIGEIRRERLGLLLAEHGTLAALNEKLGLVRADATLSQIKNAARDSKTGKPKEMGSDLARRLEAACGKETGWMDNWMDEEISRLSSKALQVARLYDRLTRPEDKNRLDAILQAFQVPLTLTVDAPTDGPRQPTQTPGA